ncbi:hypothetical protein [Streptomyces sp. NPDC051132]|uniref:hypothetical protein n=1 Tax=unclassified Streptomyces TaxID=2593676 RepID=UPI0034457449
MRITVQECPLLRDRGWAAAQAGYAPAWGMAGQIHHPRILEALANILSRVPFTDSRRIRWVLATHLVITLEEVTPVTDVDILAERELALVRAPDDSVAGVPTRRPRTVFSATPNYPRSRGGRHAVRDADPDRGGATPAAAGTTNDAAPISSTCSSYPGRGHDTS